MRARTHILLFTSLVFLASGCTTTEETSEAAAGAKSPAETPVGVCLAVDPALEHSPLSVTLHRLVERKGLNVVAGNAPVSACRVEVRLKGRWNESFTELLGASLSYRDLLTGETRQVDQPQSLRENQENAFFANSAAAPEDVLRSLVDRLFPDRYSPNFVRTEE